MADYAQRQGHDLDFIQGRFHRSIYLRGARRCRLVGLKTAIRQPIKKCSGTGGPYLYGN